MASGKHEPDADIDFGEINDGTGLANDGIDAAGGAINILHHICMQHTYLTTPIQTIPLYFIFQIYEFRTIISGVKSESYM